MAISLSEPRLCLELDIGAVFSLTALGVSVVVCLGEGGGLASELEIKMPLFLSEPHLCLELGTGEVSSLAALGVSVVVCFGEGGGLPTCVSSEEDVLLVVFRCSRDLFLIGSSSNIRIHRIKLHL